MAEGEDVPEKEEEEEEEEERDLGQRLPSMRKMGRWHCQGSLCGAVVRMLDKDRGRP